DADHPANGVLFARRSTGQVSDCGRIALLDGIVEVPAPMRIVPAFVQQAVAQFIILAWRSCV
ncbi:hypothetical protein, partial [Sphingobium sp. DC-2]|uniref:hypothetical protein n=1 Tax=Sphingobium sp. DC-2 TaxID=1303256 RepID=UPI001ED9B444